MFYIYHENYLKIEGNIKLLYKITVKEMIWKKKKKILFVLWDTTINLSSADFLSNFILNRLQWKTISSTNHFPTITSTMTLACKFQKWKQHYTFLREQHHRLIWKHTHSTESKRTKTTSQVKCQLKLEYWEVDEIGMCIHIYFHYKRINIL